MYKPGYPVVFSRCVSNAHDRDNGPHDGHCRRYRYVLWRVWDESLNYLAVIGLNPSTADEHKADPTLAKCVKFARAWGFGALCMLNLFAWRDTDPEAMKGADEPVGPDNNLWLQGCAEGAGLVLAAWGNHGAHRGRASAVRALLADTRMQAMSITKALQPQHPLYLKDGARPAFRDAGGFWLPLIR